MNKSISINILSFFCFFSFFLAKSTANNSKHQAISFTFHHQTQAFQWQQSNYLYISVQFSCFTGIYGQIMGIQAVFRGFRAIINHFTPFSGPFQRELLKLSQFFNENGASVAREHRDLLGKQQKYTTKYSSRDIQHSTGEIGTLRDLTCVSRKKGQRKKHMHLFFA